MIIVFMLLMVLVVCGPQLYLPKSTKRQEIIQTLTSTANIAAKAGVQKSFHITRNLRCSSDAATSIPASTSSIPKHKNNFSNHLSSSSFWYPGSPNKYDPY
ncbi:hypothetical protein HMI54_009737 [Coelomomyces lativittatus]|nr:hypothetical protein HMI54_009737 [Coelomomyces lativittatus]